MKYILAICFLQLTVAGIPKNRGKTSERHEQIPDKEWEKVVRPPCNIAKDTNLEISHGDPIVREYYQGETIHVACRSGFQPVNETVLHCGGNLTHSNWNATLPQCHGPELENVVAPSCNIAKDTNLEISHGDPTVMEYYLGDTIHVACRSGFQPLQETVLHCSGNVTYSNWNATLPQCHEWCTHPNGFLNGRWYLMPENPRIQAYFACDEGYELTSGLVGWNCIDGKEDKHFWVGDDPICTESEAGEACPDPATIENGIYRPMKFDGRKYRSGEELTVVCDPGFAAIGGNVHIACREDGDWDDVIPTCQAAKCLKPDAPENGLVVDAEEGHKESYKFGEHVTYRCMDGYRMVGSENSFCQADGWHQEPPTCQEIKCVGIPELSNDKIEATSETLRPGEEFEVKCHLGRRPKDGDRAYVLCQDDGTWDMQYALCEEISCDPPGNLENGRVRFNEAMSPSEKFSFGSVATFTCNSPFHISGSSKRSCRKWGWSGSTPKCVESFCSQPFLGNMVRIVGSQKEESRYQVDTLLKFECPVNYKLEGSHSMQCTTHGWTGTPPFCKLSGCLNPEIPANYIKNSEYRSQEYRRQNYYGFRESFVIKCRDGYKLQARNQFVRMYCPESGVWPSFPKCEAITCNRPNPPNNGWILDLPEKQTAFLVGYLLRLKCKEGFEIGEETRVCNLKGHWHGPLLHCLPKRCPNPTDKHGTWYSLGNGYNSVGDQVVLQCDATHRLLGPGNKTCLSSGAWSPQNSYCQTIECIYPGIPENSYIEGNLAGPFYVGSTLTYKCHNGYGRDPNVEDAIHCTISGSWSANPPTCSKVSVQDVNYYAPCEEPRFVENGFLRPYPNMAGVFQLECSSGYYLEGYGYLHCESSRWRLGFGQCRADPKFAPCEKLPENIRIINRKGWRQDYRSGTELEVECAPGSQTALLFKITCDHIGRWNPKVDCQPIQRPKAVVCAALPNNVFFKEVDANAVHRPGSIISYTCTDRQHFQNLECGEDGRWNTETIDCPSKTNEQQIAELGSPTNVIGRGISPNSGILQWEPAYGNHQIAGYRIFYTSDAKLPLHLWKISNLGNEQMTKTLTGLEPDTTYTVQMLAHTAQTFGLLSHRINFKTKPKLEVPDQPIGMKAIPTSTTIQLSWAKPEDESIAGYEVYCNNTSSGKITPFSVPNVQTFVIENLSPNTLYYVSLVAKSRHGLSPTTPLLPVRTSDQSDTSCGMPEEILNGNFVTMEGVKGLNIDAEVLYQCNQGYELIGDEIRICLESGWSGEPPTCQAIQCWFQDSPTERYNPGQVAFVSCAYGSRPKEGLSSLLCLSNGTWNSTAYPCEATTCPVPEIPEFGQILDHNPNQKRYALSSQVEFECLPGFELQGNSSILCLESGWSTNNTKCIAGAPKVCAIKPTGVIPNGRANGHKKDNSYVTGDTLTVSCFQNYKLLGEANRIICNEHGKWIKPDTVKCVPKNQRVVCPKPGNIANCDIINAKSSYVPGDELHFNCLEGYRLTSGNDYLFCEEDGEWDDQFPVCHEATCMAPKEPEYGSYEEYEAVNDEEVDYLYEINFFCHPGYQIVGARVIKCRENGWSAELPKCKSISCSEPQAPSNGQKHGSSFAVGDKVTFDCFSGFELLGSKERTCEPHGQWSGQLTICDTGTTACKNPGQPLNGFVTGVSYGIGDVVRFACNSGYSLIGSHKRKCTANGTWTGEEAKCIGKHQYDNPEEVSRQFQQLAVKLTEVQRRINNWKPGKGNPEKRRYNAMTLYFLFDSSSSIGLKNFKRSINLAKSIVKMFEDSEKTFVAGASFSFGAQVEFPPIMMKNKTEVLERLDNILYSGGSTSIDEAFRILNTSLLPLSKEAVNTDTQSVVFLLTDGKFKIGSNPVKLAREIFKGRQPFLYAIGLTGYPHKDILYSIVNTAGRSGKVFFLDSFSTMDQLANDIALKTLDYSACGTGLDSSWIPTSEDERGATISSSDWPWMVVIYYWDGPRNLPICSGSLLNERWVLTASSCFEGSDHKYLDHRTFVLSVGVSGSENATIHSIKRYTGSDVALIQLQFPVKLGPRVRPVCLPRAPLIEDGSELGYFNSWEFIKQKEFTAMRSKPIYLKIQRRKLCMRSLENSENFTNLMFCAGEGKVRPNPCDTALGGPLLVQRAQTNGGMVWSQVGLLNTLLDKSACSTSLSIYGFFLDVHKISPWIHSFVK